jgi:membrane fusion protein (multidrug efflux system)
LFGQILRENGKPLSIPTNLTFRLLALSLIIAPLLAVAQPQERGTPTVVTVPAQVKSFPLSAEALGNARANESIDIRAKITATLMEIRFEEGQSVKAGDILVKLDDLEPVADLASAKAAEVEAEASYKRSKELFKNKVGSESQLLQDEAKKIASQAMVSVAEARLAYTIVRAPFDGRIGLRRVSVGSLVGPTIIITTLDDTDLIKVDFDLPEIYLSRLQKGLAVKARSAAWPDEEFVGEVSSVDTRVDPISRTVRVRSVMPNTNGHLRPGMFLAVTLLNDSVEALVVPERALIPERSIQYVLVVDENQVVERRIVEIGRRRPGEVEILKGLNAGENVIVDGTQKARDGQPVIVQPADPTSL